MTTSEDYLAGATWECAWAPADQRADPENLLPGSGWHAAAVPGTAAGALFSADADAALLRDYDSFEWWFRTTADVPLSGPHHLHLGGLATVADVWVADRHVLRSENMFVAHDVHVELPRGPVAIVMRFSPLADLTSVRRPRPRWRSSRVRDQNLRWVRTTMLGRLPGWAHSPAPVGPWRPVSLHPAPTIAVTATALTATCHDGPSGGTVVLEAEIRGPLRGDVAVQVGDVITTASTTAAAGHHLVRAQVEMPEADRWWPHTHGQQPLYDVRVLVDGVAHPVGRVGFRTLEVDRTDGAFTFLVNGVELFARGTSWAPVDLVNFHVEDDALRHEVALMREGGHNMVRLPGNGVYEDRRFYDLLDETGILLWQDCMFAFLDTPDDPLLLASIETELAQVFRLLQGRPSLALVCGGADTEEQAAYHGVPRDAWASAVATRNIPEILDRLLPGTPYLRATPGDSPLPTATNAGVSHYLSVPAYQRPVEDFRVSDVRFAAECLPLPTPPEPLPLPLQARVRRGAGLTTETRLAVHRDSETVPWDMADTMTPYMEDIFGIRDLSLRQQFPERVDSIRAATSVYLFERCLSEWRRAGSRCAGALTLYGRDPRWGPGLGLLDSLGRPKSTWYAMRRLSTPVAVLLTDEGFSGLGVHLVNDTDDDIEGVVVVDLYADGRLLLESDSLRVRVPRRGGCDFDTTRLFDGFRDLSWAYRFGPPAADVVAVRLVSADGGVLAEAVHLPGGPARQLRPDLGLAGQIDRDGDGWTLTVSTVEFAQWVQVDLVGWRAQDSWFHLLPEHVRSIPLVPDRLVDKSSPAGWLRALNSQMSPTVTVVASPGHGFRTGPAPTSSRLT